MHISTWCQK